MKRAMTFVVICGAVLCTAIRVHADVTVKVDPSSNWVGFMNVFELPENGGGYVFGSSWGVPDLVAIFSDPTLTLTPNTIGDPNEFWYQCVGGAVPPNCGGPGAPGNKTMDANLYVEPPAGTYAGQTVTFTGTVLSNSLTDAHTSTAFIKDFAPDYSSSVSVSMPLTPGPFSISLAAIADAGRHVQYGFETIGPNVWVTDVEPFGEAVIALVPEPASALLGIVAMAGLGMLGFRRRAG